MYRGQAAPAIQGTYVYADFWAGFVRSFRLNNGSAIEQTEWPLLATPSIASFGQDDLGELYADDAEQDSVSDCPELDTFPPMRDNVTGQLVYDSR